MTAARKGYSKRADIPAEVLAKLNAGSLATATLAEALAVDFAVLLRAVKLPAVAVKEMTAAAGLGVTRRMELAGCLLLAHLTPAARAKLAAHPSDTVRGWVCYAIAHAPDGTVADRLALIRPFAADPHFGVREWAWLAVRPHVVADIRGAIAALTPWVADTDYLIRRFAVEATRPRGVWAAHIPELATDPDLGRPLLDPLHAATEKYVQDSVANWLNDAAKTSPDWVRRLCREWRARSGSAATARICTRAERSL